MKNLELRAERIRRGRNVPYMCQLLGISTSTYYAREAGTQKFKPDEIVKISNDFGFTPKETSLIFFDNKLPTG